MYNADSLLDSDGKMIKVIHPGEYNRDAGPDFFNSRLLIGATIWAGNVEIHTRSSHFEMHGHHTDKAFNNVILHVVAENDRKVFNQLGEELLTTEIKFDHTLYDKYLLLLNNPYVIACQDEFSKVDKILIRHWLTSLLIERLQEKAEMILSIMDETGNDWDETFYRLLSRYFGFRVNTEPFEMLARALPFRIIRKHADNRFQIEALLFGSAGMLEEGLFKDALSDEYYRNLIREYRILSSKYSLQALQGWIWKFSRLRPANFATLRISQLASMLSATGGLFSKVIESDNVTGLKKLFEVSASAYWDDHYVFGRKSRKSKKSTGSQTTDILLINAVIPAMFVFGKSRDREDICERALNFLEGVEAEDNKIISEWRNAGMYVESAFDSQALIQLRNEYCRNRKCLSCRIGSKIISSGNSLKDQEELILEP